MQKIKKLLVPSFLALFIISGNAVAKEDQSQIPAILQSAFNQITKAANLNQETRFTYRFQHHSSGILTTEILFDPILADGEQLQIIAPTKQSNPEAYNSLLNQKQQVNLQYDTEKTGFAAQHFERILGNIGFPVQQSTTPKGNLLLSFPITGEYKLPGGQLKKNIAKYLDGEIELDAVTGHIIRTKIYSRKAFKPMIVVKVENYSIENHFQQFWTDGPVLETAMDLQIMVKAMGKRYDVKEKTRRFAIEKR